MNVFKNLYLGWRFYLGAGIITFLFALSFPYPALFVPAQGTLVLLLAIVGVDIYILFRKNSIISANRSHAQLLSLGDKNKITIRLLSKANFKLFVTIVDDLPEQLQIRDFSYGIELEPYQKYKFTYNIVPKSRGIYKFHNINLFLRSPLFLIERRVIVEQSKEIAVYPSIIQMKNYEIMAVTSISHFQGVKKIRKIGHSYEFEQIKPYTPGDDTRSINWKASGRAGDLMINQYEDERSQPVYSIIDKSRIMKMPFNGLSLLDYAINTSLTISNVVLKKHDKAGLLTFSNKLGTVLRAEKSFKQLQQILHALYNEKEAQYEADYELLYSAVRNFIRGRSLLFLYTNFESVYGLQRVLPLLRKLNRLHLLVVMYFENTELIDFTKKSCTDIMDIYQQTAAKQAINQKSQILQELNNHGIQAIKTTPENLSIDTINKYLELKARGYI